jgi:hypothetical protein
MTIWNDHFEAPLCCMWLVWFWLERRTHGSRSACLTAFGASAHAALHAAQEALTEEQFASDLDELAKSKLEKPRKLQTLATRWCAEVLLARFDWQRPATEVAVLRQLTRRDLVSFVDEAMLGSRARRRLCVNVVGKQERQRGSGGNGAEAGGEPPVNEASDHARGGENGDAGAAAASQEGTCQNGLGNSAARAGSNGDSRTCQEPVAEKAPAADKDSAAAANAAKWGEDVVLRVLPHELPQFRMQQRTWAQSRGAWWGARY